MELEDKEAQHIRETDKEIIPFQQIIAMTLEQ